MGYEIRLDTSQLTATLVQAYYDYLEQKWERGEYPDEWLDKVRRQRSHDLDEIHDNEIPSIYWNTSREFSETESWPEFTEMLPDWFEEPHHVFDPEEKESLVRIFQDIEAELVSENIQPNGGLEYTPAEREAELELGIISICEFASEHDVDVVIEP